MSKLVFSALGLGHLANDLFFDDNNKDEWSPMDIWTNATLAFIYSAFVELVLVRLSFFKDIFTHYSALARKLPPKS